MIATMIIYLCLLCFVGCVCNLGGKKLFENCKITQLHPKTLLYDYTFHLYAH